MTVEEKLNLYRMIYSDFKCFMANFWTRKNTNDTSIVFDAEKNIEYTVDAIGTMESKYSKGLINLVCIGDANTYNEGVAVNEIIYKDNRIVSIENNIGIYISKSYIIDIDNNKVILILFTEKCKTAIVYDTNIKCVDTIITNVDISFKKVNEQWNIVLGNTDISESKNFIVNKHMMSKVLTIDNDAIIDEDYDNFDDEDYDILDIEYDINSIDNVDDNYTGYSEEYLDYN